jgi:FKBP-type peptidyl-prolyl cis-trans isomerase FkpA
MKRVCVGFLGVLCGLALGGVAMAQDEVPAAESLVKPFRPTATVTTLKVSAGTLGQPVTFNVKVRAPAKAGSPPGTVTILDQLGLIQTVGLVPTNSTSPLYAYSVASYTMTPEPGGKAYYFGGHPVGVQYNPGNTNFAMSRAINTVLVKRPKYQILADGVKIFTVAQGSGSAIQSGQTASIFYTGYLALTGAIFDDSVDDGGSPLSFTIGAGQVITGFNAGVYGMKVGETRIIVIPPAEAYGRSGQGSIPPESTLLFVVTLEGIF